MRWRASWYHAPAMQFEYEITAAQFASAQLLYRKQRHGRKRTIRWILAGIVLIAIALTERSLNLTPILVALLGASWIYSAIVSLSPWYFRRAYFKTDLVDKKFKADVNEIGFDVTGDECAWRVKWAAVREKGENERLFLFYSHGTLFVFGKEFFGSEEQGQLRKFSGLA